jgi:spore germination protein GerM
MRRRTLWLMALVLVGCGIPVDNGPEVVDLEVAAPPDDEQPTLGELAAVSMYLVRNDALVHVTRDLPSPPSPHVIFESLLEGVTEPEERANLRSSVPPGTRIIEVRENGSTLHVDLSREFAGVGGEEEILAVAQIVLTAASIEGVDLVAFELEGVPTDVPVAGGALSVDPVSADDYASLVAP